MPDDREYEQEWSSAEEPQSGIDEPVAVISTYTESASDNITRSRQLIKTLEETTQRSLTVVERARSFHEMHKMLSVSKTMSERSKAQIKYTATQRKNNPGKTE